VAASRAEIEGINLTEIITRAAMGFLAAGAIAFAARRLRALSSSGAVAATVMGTLTVAADWSWGILLIAFFASVTVLSKYGEQRKAELLGAIVEKGDERDGWQVLANGGVFAVAALAHLIWNSPIPAAIGAGALAASAADTWATEIGTLSPHRPVSILSSEPVPAGTSGAVTLAGSVAGVAGALFVAALTTFARWPVTFAAVALGGIAGAVADSILGATAQCRRWCDACGKSTERRVHDCGAETHVSGGAQWLDNDGVNALCSVVGALITLLLQ
jgi:uncharacterized protein (TIGR00297 family)